MNPVAERWCVDSRRSGTRRVLHVWAAVVGIACGSLPAATAVAQWQPYSSTATPPSAAAAPSWWSRLVKPSPPSFWPTAAPALPGPAHTAQASPVPSGQTYAPPGGSLFYPRPAVETVPATPPGSASAPYVPPAGQYAWPGQPQSTPVARYGTTPASYTGTPNGEAEYRSAAAQVWHPTVNGPVLPTPMPAAGDSRLASPAASSGPVTPYNGYGLPGRMAMPSAAQGANDGYGAIEQPGPGAVSAVSGSMVAESCAAVDLYDGCEPWRWHIAPVGLIYRPYLAGVKEPRLAAVFNEENNRGSILDLTAGARVALLRYGTTGWYEPQGWELEVEGAAFPRLDPEEEMDMEASDFRFGVPLAFGWGSYQMKIAYFHLSSHLGDEYALRNGLAGRLNYSRDALVWGHSLDLNENWRVYGEVSYAFYCDVSEPWDCQFGVEYSPRLAFGLRGAPFAAINTHLRQEVDFGGNFVFQTGWQWISPQNGQRIRLGLQVYNGQEEQYQFYTQSEQKVGFGLWYDF